MVESSTSIKSYRFTIVGGFLHSKKKETPYIFSKNQKPIPWVAKGLSTIHSLRKGAQAKASAHIEAAHGHKSLHDENVETFWWISHFLEISPLKGAYLMYLYLMHGRYPMYDM
jgi:hypothetical protein